MTFLPIVARELRVSARRRGTFWLRVSAGLAAITLGTWWFLMNRGESRERLSVPMFGIMTGSATLYCLLSGLWFTADCLSREKREGTLGLLFLTDLRGYDVVLGKLAASSLGAIYGVLAVVPMLGVPLLIGGVMPSEFGRMALVVPNALFLSLTLGLAVSAVSRSGRRATVAAFGLLLGIAVIPPVLSALLEAIGRWPSVQALLLLPSPLFTFATAFDFAYTTNRMSNAFWWSLGLVHALAWVFLGVSSFAARRSWQDQPEATPDRRWWRWWERWGRGTAEERSAQRREMLDLNAYYWLAARARQRPFYVWCVLGFLALVWAGRVARNTWLTPPTYLGTALMLNGLIKVWVALEAPRQLAEERHQGTLELLLSTALPVEEVLRGQWLALARQFLAPVLVIQGLLLAFLLGTLRDAESVDDRPFFTWFYVMGIVMLVVDLNALYWLGMWQGLTAKTPQRAFVGSLVRILLLPWVGLALSPLVLAFVAPIYQPGGYTWFNLWLGFGLAADIGFVSWARFKLLTEFRKTAAERFGSAPPPTAAP